MLHSWINTLLIIFIIIYLILYRAQNIHYKYVTRYIPRPVVEKSTTEKHVKFSDTSDTNNDIIDIEENEYESYDDFNGSVDIHLTNENNNDDTLNNITSQYRNNTLTSIEGTYRGRQNYPADIEMYNTVIN